MLTLKLLSIAALLGSIAWFIHSPDFEPAIAAISSLSACIAAFWVDRTKRRIDSMHQSVGTGGVGIQAGGDVSTGNITTKTNGK
jgi:hypothetical protein